MNELLDLAVAVDRALATAQRDPDLDTTDVRAKLAVLGGYVGRVAFFCGPYLALPDEDGDLRDDGSDWQQVIHSVQRTVKVAPERGREAVVRALAIARTALAPLAGAARMRERQECCV